MAVRFVVGRAGSGKTRHCIESLQSELQRDPRDGPRQILLVPEQASLQTERMLLAGTGLTGLERGEVLSFRRFAHRILQARPLANARVLSGVSRSMLLQRLLQEHRDELVYLRPSRSLPGLYRQLSNQIEEFIGAALKPEDVVLKDAPPDSALALKLADLRLLYGRYLALLEQGLVDPVTILDHARTLLPEVPWLEGCRVWLDGFAGFTGQETEFLVVLARRAAHMDITLLADAEELEGPTTDSETLFGGIVRTHRLLLQRLRSESVPMEAPLILERPSRPARADLAFIEEHAFQSDREMSGPPPNITLYRASDPRDELEFVADHIVRLTRRPDGPLRYRDIAVITRQLDDLHDAIGRVLQENDIPYFIDRKPPLSEHPLYFLVKNLLDAAVERFAIEAMRRLLKSDLLGMDPVIIDRLENYALAHDLTGRRQWTSGPWTHDPLFRSPLDRKKDAPQPEALLQRINKSRDELLDKLQPWLAGETLEAGRRESGAWWAARLYQTLERLGVWQQLQIWSEQASRTRRAAEAEYHQRAWLGVVRLLDDFETALGAVELTLEEFAGSLEAGLTRVDTGLVPPAIDQVLVGSIERSRHPALRVAFVVGMNDGVFPLAAKEQQLLNDAERRILIEQDVPVDPPQRQRLAEERLLAYIAWTRPSEHLYISYCQGNLEGDSLEPSPYIAELRARFPDLPVHVRDSGGAAGLSGVHNSRRLACALAEALSSGREPGLWNAVYERARVREDFRPELTRALRGLHDLNWAELPADLAVPPANEAPLTSVTALEEYSACPFKHFAGQQLKLKTRTTADLDALRMGSLSHAVLDAVTRKILDGGQSLKDLTDEDIADHLAEVFETIREQRPFALDRQAYFWRRCHDEIGLILRILRDMQARGQARTLASELPFGLPSEGAVAGLECHASGDRRFILRGKIDRVDVLDTPSGKRALVFDYKSGKGRQLQLEPVYHGLSMQLISYLLTLDQEAGPALKPGGAFYIALNPDYEAIKHPDKVSDNPYKDFRPRGIFAAELFKLLDVELKLGISTVVSAQYNKGGSLGKRGDAVPLERLERLMEHVCEKLAEVWDQLAGGHIAVEPYRLGPEMPCKFCRYRAVCRFELPEISIRRLERLKDHDIWERITSD